MISYAQNGEDVVLARLFGRVAAGVWIDVGAGDPEVDSVTKLLSDQGWWGVNLEPDPSLLARLEAARPRDRNLGVAASDHAGRGTLHVAPAPGRSTLEPDHVVEELGAWRTIEVPMATVAAIAADAGLERVDLLKIDVEGHERQVLAGADLARLRPRVVLVEATLPGSPTPSYEPWEPIVVDAGYVCALDDGLNRFYVAAGDAEAIAALRVPANVHDDFVRRADEERLRAASAAMAEAAAAYAALDGRARELEAEVAAAQRRIAALEADVEAGRDQLARGRLAEERLHAVDATLAALEEQAGTRAG